VNLAEVNIDCLRAAESLLRDHDARITAAAEELKLLRRDRVTLAERVQACIDVLCGRATPDLFTPAATPPVVAEPQPAEDLPADDTPAPPATPPASGLLADIPGITADDAHDMAAAGLRTLADLEAALAGGLTDYYRATRSVNAQVYKVLVVPKGVFLGPDADRVANAVEKYLTVAAPAAVPAEEDEVPPAKTKGKKAKATGEPKRKSKKGKVKV
jgi:hypothetical protein